MENTTVNGTVTIGIDYYTQLIEENASLKERFETLARFLDTDNSKVVYTEDVKRILRIIQ